MAVIILFIHLQSLHYNILQCNHKGLLVYLGSIGCGQEHIVKWNIEVVTDTHAHHTGLRLQNTPPSAGEYLSGTETDGAAQSNPTVRVHIVDG